MLEWTAELESAEEAKVRELGAGLTIQLRHVNLETGFVDGKVKVGVNDELLIHEVNMVLREQFSQRQSSSRNKND